MAQDTFRLKTTTKWLHTWTGITVGGLVSLTCLTGSVIMFRQEVERPPSAHDHATAGPQGRSSLDAAARDIDHLQPGARVTRVRFPATPQDPYVFQIRSAGNQTQRIAFDASSGRILGEVPRVGWMEWTVDLHRNLLAGRPGRNVVGGAGIVLLVLGVTALLLWLINGANWRGFVTIRKGPWRRFTLEFHRAAGLWALCFLVVLSITGIGLSYSQALRGAWERMTGQPASVHPPKLFQSAAQHPKSLDQYIAAGRAAIPDGEPTELRIAESPQDPVVVRFHRAGDLSPVGSNRVFLDPASGKALSVDLAANWPLGVRLFQSLSPIHYGEFGGMPIKILWTILGVAPAFLFATGLLVWWRPKRLKPGRYREPSAREVVITPLAPLDAMPQAASPSVRTDVTFYRRRWRWPRRERSTYE